MRISIDDDACTGHGRCYALAPGVFECDDMGRGVVIAAEVRPDLEEQARAAERNCPEHAVIIE